MLVKIIFKNSVLTSKRTHFTITKINWLTLVKEIIAVTSRLIQDPEIQNAELLIGKAGDTYSCHSALKD
jgi:hypothetical protein